MDDDALCGDARLAVVEAPGGGGDLGGPGQVGGGQDDDGVAAARFEHRLFHSVPGNGGHPGACRP
jgi:hypothetical protein